MRDAAVLCRIRSMAQTLCYDLARAEKAKDGKKSVSYTEKVARLHASKFGNVEGKCFHISDFSVALGTAPRHVQKVHFWPLKSPYFLETR